MNMTGYRFTSDMVSTTIDGSSLVMDLITTEVPRKWASDGPSRSLETVTNGDGFTVPGDLTFTEAGVLTNHMRVSVTEIQVIYMIIGVFGFVGNGFTMFVFCSSKQLRKILTNHFLINQSVIDILASVFLLATIKLEQQNLDGAAGYLLCVFWNTSFMVWTLLLASTFNLVSLSIERWFKVAHPLVHRVYFSKTVAYAMMSASWIFAIIYQVSLCVATSAVIDGHCYPFQLWSSKRARSAFAVITFLVKLFVPVAVIAYCYLSMLSAIRKSSHVSGLQNNKRKQDLLKAQRNIFKTLVIVVICFILCVSWNQVIFLLFNTGLVKVNFNKWDYHMSVILYHLNCCVNPIIYAFNYREFKAVARNIICKNTVVPQPSLVHSHSIRNVILTGSGSVQNQSLSDNNGVQNQSLSDNKGVQNQSLSDNNGVENQSICGNNGVQNQSLSDNNGVQNQSLSDNNGVQRLTVGSVK